MDTSTNQSKRLQWKWVGITFAMYILFYIIPIYIATFFTNKIVFVIFSSWIFGGIIIVAAVAGYLSKGVTIWEPAIAGAGLVFLFFIGIILFIPPGGMMVQAIIPIAITTVSVFLLSLLGAWMGERAQKLWKTKSPEST